jgi:hypothetical protein
MNYVSSTSSPTDLRDAACRALRYRWILLILVARSLVNTAFADTTYWRVTMDRVTVLANRSRDRCTRLTIQLLTFERLLTDLAGLSPDYQTPPIAL